jgi:hypothetical protein
MNECSFCDKGVAPFYTLSGYDGSPSICHTCFHTGKHKQPAKVPTQGQPPKPAEHSAIQTEARKSSTSKR